MLVPPLPSIRPLAMRHASMIWKHRNFQAAFCLMSYLHTQRAFRAGCCTWRTSVPATSRPCTQPGFSRSIRTISAKVRLFITRALLSLAARDSRWWVVDVTKANFGSRAGMVDISKTQSNAVFPVLVQNSVQPRMTNMLCHGGIALGVSMLLVRLCSVLEDE